MLFLSGLLRVVLALFVLRVLLRALAAFVRQRSAPASKAPATPAPLKGGELVRDQVCNTFVPQARALRASVAGREQYFCSAECRDRALLAVSRAS